jgi:DNA polymerase elongation subunit (family B)
VTAVKTLFLDIETAPNTAYVWGFFDQNISQEQVEESSYVLCWAAKWYGEKQIHFASAEKKTHREVLKPVHKLLDEADVVIHYNGTKFDIPTLNREFIKYGFTPPSPYKQLDLLRVVRRAFRFESNKLAYVTEALGLHTKAEHEGFKLWVKCMKGDREAWKAMEAYNRTDVKIMEPLYERLRPWIDKHPTIRATSDGMSCPKCGGLKVQKRGLQVAISRTYTRYHCQECGGWFRSNKSVASEKVERGVNITA